MPLRAVPAQNEYLTPNFKFLAPCDLLTTASLLPLENVHHVALRHEHRQVERGKDAGSILKTEKELVKKIFPDESIAMS
jgi:hypothetical protein